MLTERSNALLRTPWPRSILMIQKYIVIIVVVVVFVAFVDVVVIVVVFIYWYLTLASGSNSDMVINQARLHRYVSPPV